MIGQTLSNRYTIVARLGKGAMGTVYLATDKHIGQDVALKMLSSELALDAAMLERFKREAEALRQLKHPNIVGFLDAFEHGEHYVIVMEYIPSGSLYDLIRAGPLPIDRASQIALDLCDALIRAHRLNIVHRDIKPDNVMIDRDGTPKLADFGVARLIEGTRMTHTGTKVGTPYYMAPEAWKGETIDAQSDIWSLGVMIFEMLVGKVPFDGDSEFAVMTKICTTPPPDLKKLRADVSPGLVKIITRMLTREKDLRYQTVREVAVDLERGEPATTPFSPRSKTASKKKENKKPAVLPKNIIGVTSLVILALGLVVVYMMYSQGRFGEPSSTQFSATDTSIPASPTSALGIGSTTISEKDGMVMVYVPAGEFTMGSENGEDVEKPAHTVTLDAFWIDQTEVTNAMYAKCVSDGECDRPDSTASYTQSDYFGNSEFDKFPVIHVSWDVANVYCSWAERRLPTDAEWEKAARGENARTYPWGNEPPNNSLLNYNNAVGDTTEVGKFPTGASPYDAYDMAGNVREWVSSLHQPYPYDATDGREDLSADGSRVLRAAHGSFFTVMSVRQNALVFLKRLRSHSVALDSVVLGHSNSVTEGSAGICASELKTTRA